jgi:3-phenylpropionate/trans-cinnamate dioxygenase ferredoxin reductase component
VDASLDLSRVVKTVVVVGAGIAGTRTVERLRARGYEGRIVVIGAEPHVPYDRPPLSKSVLRGEQELPSLFRTMEAQAELAEWRQGVTALHLDTEKRQLETDGGVVPFDVAVIATGSRARRLAGLPGDVLRTWDDAQSLRTQLVPGSTVAIIGAGLIGCEVAATAIALGARVHLVDVVDAPMTRVVGPALAATVVQLHRSHGVVLHLSTTASVGDRGSLRLSDGTVLTADVTVQAVGSVPEMAWLDASGLNVAGGVLCDAAGRTTAPGIYAVGDVANWNGTRSEHWTRAVEQADAVAAAITGQPQPAEAPAYWWSDQYDIRFQGVGTIAGTDDVRTVSWGPSRRIIGLFGSGGRLVAGVGLSAPKGVMALRAHIANQSALDDVVDEYEATAVRT